MTQPTHSELIVDQFTRQAVPFSTAKTIADQKALDLLLEVSGAGPDDTVLDVACGGGNVVCAFAPKVRHATGIDMTPAMLERARATAKQKSLGNVSWDQGMAAPLPYADASFSIVVTRFSFHHFLDPLAVLKEMKRVCAPGGRVLVADMHTHADAAKGAEFNRMELLRDPSHVRALPVEELKALFPAAGLPPARITYYELRDELENLLGRSFPNPGDDDKIREIFRTSSRDDRLGIPIRIEGERINYAYPVAVLAATHP
ncbi:MAG TPA: methyltransferase domain-containing protein [Burkholderiales bacterium]|nr:methyltransferase domain-containing protein [Burkholderiales bacterium]